MRRKKTRGERWKNRINYQQQINRLNRWLGEKYPLEKTTNQRGVKKNITLVLIDKKRNKNIQRLLKGIILGLHGE